MVPVALCLRRFASHRGRTDLAEGLHRRISRRTIVVTTEHGGLGYVRKLREQGVQVWVMGSPTQRVNVTDFRAKCAAEKITVFTSKVDPSC